MIQKKGRHSIKRRAASISDKKIEKMNREKPQPWQWQPDEITDFGNTRLLKTCLLPDHDITSPREAKNEDDLDEIHDWLAVLVTDAYHLTVEVYNDFVKNHATWGHMGLHPEQYPNEGYPSREKYKWKLALRNKKTGSVTEKVAILKVADYVQAVFDYFVQQMENDNIFPPDDDNFFVFPSDFKVHAKKLNQLLFRVIAIMLCNEHESVLAMGKQLKGLLRQVLYYSWLWDLIDENDLMCINTIVAPIRGEYERDYKQLESESQ